MPVTLAQLAANTAKVEIPVDDDKVTVVYYPAKITEDHYYMLTGFSQMAQENIDSTFKSFNELLVDIIKSWDLYEDVEATALFPLDIARFSRLPIAFRMQVFTTILGDVRPESFAPQTQSQG